MKFPLKQASMVIAAGCVLAFMGLISLSEVQKFIPWSPGLTGVAIAALFCGSLLALMSERSVWLMGIGSLLGVFIYAGFWTYSTWTLIGTVFSLSDPILWKLIFLYIISRGGLLFVVTTLVGALGVVCVRIILPEGYRLDD